MRFLLAQRSLELFFKCYYEKEYLVPSTEQKQRRPNQEMGRTSEIGYKLENGKRRHEPIILGN